jgi:hypothetical protein
MIRLKLLPFIAMFLSVLTAGCSTTVSLFPVEGPLSQENPVPTLQATADGIMGNTGNISLTMPNGESCTGKWSSAAGAGISVGTGSLIGTYGSVYGVGTSVSTGTGQNPGRAFLTCSKGRTIQMEFVTGAGTANGFGIAKDNKGNIYKVLF